MKCTNYVSAFPLVVVVVVVPLVVVVVMHGDPVNVGNPAQFQCRVFLICGQ